MMFQMMNLKYATDGNKNACIALNIKPVWSRQWTHSIAIMSEYERREEQAQCYPMSQLNGSSAIICTFLLEVHNEAHT